MKRALVYYLDHLDIHTAVRHANGALPTISPISEEPTVEIGSTSPDQRSPSKSPEPRPGSSQDIKKGALWTYM